MRDACWSLLEMCCSLFAGCVFVVRCSVVVACCYVRVAVRWLMVIGCCPVFGGDCCSMRVVGWLVYVAV